MKSIKYFFLNEIVPQGRVAKCPDKRQDFVEIAQFCLDLAEQMANVGNVGQLLFDGRQTGGKLFRFADNRVRIERSQSAV